MMNTSFEAVRMHFPDKISITPAELYQWIGHPECIDDLNFRNTCAIRLSLALLGAGFPSPGTYPVMAGKFRGRMIETSQRKLSNWLKGQLGTPQVFKGGREAEKQIGSRHGIVSFFNLDGPNDRQGHIDIVMLDRWGRYLRCGSNNDDAGGCYWSAVAVWFWPLK